METKGTTPTLLHFWTFVQKGYPNLVTIVARGSERVKTHTRVTNSFTNISPLPRRLQVDIIGIIIKKCLETCSLIIGIGICSG